MMDTIPYGDRMITTLNNTLHGTCNAANCTPLHTDPYLDGLAHLIALNGIAKYESDIARLVARLRSQGHDGSLTALLGDTGAASIVRERAFGAVVGQLARGPARRHQRVDSAA
jgi:hypothetical protein